MNSAKGDDGFSFRNSQSKGNKRPASAFVSEPRLKTSLTGADSAAKESGSAFISSLNRLKEYNSRGLSVSKDHLNPDNEFRPISSHGANHDSGLYYSKKQNVLASNDARVAPGMSASAEKLGTLLSNGKNLDQKRTELRGRLNELLDKLAVGGQTESVRGETRSVAPVFAGREGDDNVSLNSFHSTAPPLASLRAKNGFTSFYK